MKVSRYPLAPLTPERESEVVAFIAALEAERAENPAEFGRGYDKENDHQELRRQQPVAHVLDT